jgi:streptomycin 6-kinase
VGVPAVEEAVRKRLTARFGDDVAAWFDDLPDVLRSLAVRWRLELIESIPRGSVSVVLRCRTSDGRLAVLKVSPDVARIASEAACLSGWATAHTPAVLAVDERVGALLLEAIEPGTPLDVSASYPPADSVVELLRSLHDAGDLRPTHPTVGQRVAYLFDSSERLYDRQPELAAVVSPELYQRGRRLATRLAQNAGAVVLLHGDLTPSNILDGGDRRGLVAIDPAPCLGDPAFDAVDLVLWQADDADIVRARSEQLASALGFPPQRLLAWCTAFAGMTALELAASPRSARQRVAAAVMLAEAAFPG